MYACLSAGFYLHFLHLQQSILKKTKTERIIPITGKTLISLSKLNPHLLIGENFLLEFSRQSKLALLLKERLLKKSKILMIFVRMNVLT